MNQPLIWALVSAEFCARTLFTELKFINGIPSILGLWAQTYYIIQPHFKLDLMRRQLIWGLIIGMLSSQHPFAVALSLAISALVTHSVAIFFRLPPFLLMAFAAGLFSFLANILYWTFLAVVGKVAFKTVASGYLIDYLLKNLSSLAICDAINTSCAFIICKFILRLSPLTFGKAR